MTMAQYCGICGFVKADPTQGMGYAGNICTGHDTYKPAPISRDELRQIVSEEIAKVRKDIEEIFGRPTLETTVRPSFEGSLCEHVPAGYACEICNHDGVAQ
jgi:hypothetical protein